MKIIKLLGLIFLFLIISLYMSSCAVSTSRYSFAEKPLERTLPIKKEEKVKVVVTAPKVISTKSEVACAVPNFNKASLKVPRNSVRIKLAGGLKSLSIYGNAFALYSDGKRIEIAKSEAKFYLYGGKVKYKGKKYKQLRLIPLSEENLLKFNSARYRGNFVIRIDDRSKLCVINTLPFLEYLKGVVPAEIGNRPEKFLEAVKVQAIAARTYAYSRLGKNDKFGFDLYSTVDDQVYKGADVEREITNRAVDETQDIVITHADTLIQAFYFSTSPGKTANIEEVWDAKGYRPYLRSVKDNGYNTESRYHRWSYKWGNKELENILNKNLNRLVPNFKKGRLKSISVVENTTSNRVKTLKIKMSSGTYEIYGDKTRWALRRPGKSASILPSSWFKIKKIAGKWVAHGGGFGHGVGLSQYGALGMADAGLNYSAIINHYYTDVKLAKVSY